MPDTAVVHKHHDSLGNSMLADFAGDDAGRRSCGTDPVCRRPALGKRRSADPRSLLLLPGQGGLAAIGAAAADTIEASELRVAWIPANAPHSGDPRDTMTK